ncbi:MAG: iron-sulfur cluster insertion protein ErpA, partial [Gammaproteobacteria bacterium]
MSEAATTTPVVDLTFTDAAASKVKRLIEEEKNPNLKLRLYISG